MGVQMYCYHYIIYPLENTHEESAGPSVEATHRLLCQVNRRSLTNHLERHLMATFLPTNPRHTDLFITTNHVGEFISLSQEHLSADWELRFISLNLHASTSSKGLRILLVV